MLTIRRSRRPKRCVKTVRFPVLHHAAHALDGPPRGWAPSLARSLAVLPALQEDVWDDFETLDKAKKVAKLKAFGKFDNTTEALEAAASLVDSKLSKGLKKFLKKNAEGETLGVVDAKLGSIIKEKLGIPCIYSSGILELSRGLRNQLEGLLTGFESDLKPMSLGLSHSLSRYKLKFSPDKVDTMIVQAIGLLDDLDKELNTYAMRVREWYGWHFPEMTKIINDNIKYAKAAKLMETRDKAADIDFSEFLEEEEESAMKEAAIVSMGTEISAEDVLNISALCDQVIALSEYRGQLFDYLRSRMAAIAPNLTVLVGELVGARLIAHVGSLVNLAKAPASTIQILGAEKALFRALKTKHETPKYGLIYHASLIGQASAKNKGKISRVLAAKCALGVRVDALGDTNDEGALGLEARARVRCCRRCRRRRRCRCVAFSRPSRRVPSLLVWQNPGSFLQSSCRNSGPLLVFTKARGRPFNSGDGKRHHALTPSN